MRPRVRYWLPGRFALALARATDALWQRWIVPHSITCLRVSMGIVFVLFGALKFFPGVSPVEDLVEATTAMLTLGVVHGGLALPLVATIECAIGLALLTGRAMRGAMYLLAGHMIGILSPVVLMPGRLFAGPHGTPTLEGQYIVKDIILVGATLVLATTLGGARASAQQRHAPSVADSYDCDEISYS